MHTGIQRKTVGRSWRGYGLIGIKDGAVYKTRLAFYADVM